MTVLVLRALGLGDLVTGLPALRLLREARPRDYLVLATPPRWWPLVERAGTVNATVPAEELAPIGYPPFAPALAVDLHGNGPRSRDVLAAVEPRRLIAYADGATRWRPSEHEVTRWCRLLAEQLPAPAPVAPTVAGTLGSPPHEPDVPTDRVVVHCGAKAASRRWPASRFAAVALLLAAEGHDVVVVGGPAERELAARVAMAAEVEVRDNLSVLELAALIGTARLVVSGDTGAAHLAAAYQVPTVTLFGPISPRVWGPPERPRHQVVWHGDGTGDPHGRATDPALMRITVAEVIDAAHRALAHANA